jgi:prophage antirepressor-like protein
MNQLINHPQFGDIRVETIKNEPWFCAKDVCQSLEYSKDISSVLDKLDNDEKGTANFRTLGGEQNLLVVNESGLYALIIRSNKPVARKFRKWVTSEVLPSIRKYGTYSTDERVMDKAMRRAETLAVKKLLATTAVSLSTTDKRLIAKQCLTSEYEVNKVLSGQKEDVTMLALLYARATSNKKMRPMFYSLEGAEKLVNLLIQ